MSASHKKINTKQRQYEVMVDFMIKHPDLAKGHLNVSNAKSKSKDLWTRLSQDLNDAGPPTHDYAKWKKVWADYKNHIKVKSRENRKSISGTGGGPSKYCSLTQLEEKVVTLLAIDKAVGGTDGTFHFGAKSNESTAPTSNSASVRTVQHQEDDDTMEEYLNIACEETFSSPQAENISDTPHRRRQRENQHDKNNLLSKQVENQITYQENSLKAMSEIDLNMKSCLKILTDVNQNLAGVNKYLKRSCDLEERKYKLAKEKFEFKRKIEYENTKRKMEHLELKKQILDLKSRKQT